jgi:hypothetical protein
MVALTENLVLSKSRADNLASVKRLNLWGNDFSDVSIIQQMKNVEILSLSVNSISSLEDFQYCMPDGHYLLIQFRNDLFSKEAINYPLRLI